jgi:excisionase family DNA binding protein
MATFLLTVSGFECVYIVRKGDIESMNLFEVQTWYTIPQLAKLVSLSRKTVWLFVAQGRLKSTRYGAQHRITEADWQQFMNDNNKPK